MEAKKVLIQEIIEKARGWINVPYHHQGRSKAGCDCVAVVVDIANNMGMKVNDWTRYGPVPRGNKLVESFREHMVEIPLTDYGPGDVVLLSWKRIPHHVAIVTDVGSGRLGLLHCNREIGKVVEHGINDVWQKRIVMAFRFKVIEDSS